MVTFGKNLEFIAAEAFPACTNLKSAYFTGDAPGTGAGGNIFSSGSNIIVYYPEGASVWDTTWNGYITQAYTLESDEPAPAPVEPAQPVESTQPSISTGNNPFTDVPTGSYYYDAVLWALENGITDGVSADKFQPNATCTRGQVVTFLWRSKGCPEPVIKTNPFTDVKASSPFYKAILWAYENGITTGDTDTTFNPDGTCTSAHVVTFLWRAKGKPFASGASALANTYPNAYYTDAVAWADSDGLLYGTSSAFAPDALSPRADIVTYLYRDAI